jgi:hypothetical protein
MDVFGKQFRDFRISEFSLVVGSTGSTHSPEYSKYNTQSAIKYDDPQTW